MNAPTNAVSEPASSGTGKFDHPHPSSGPGQLILLDKGLVLAPNPNVLASLRLDLVKSITYLSLREGIMLIRSRLGRLLNVAFQGIISPWEAFLSGRQARHQFHEKVGSPALKTLHFHEQCEGSESMKSLGGSSEFSQITTTTNTNFGPIFKGIHFCQRFRSERNNLSSIYLWVATGGKKIDSVAKLSILDGETRQVIRQTEICTLECSNNHWHRFFFTPIPDSQGRIYWFSFETSGEDEAITLWTNNEVQRICQRNGTDLGESICFKCDYEAVPAYLLDDLLFKYSVPAKPVSPESEEELHRIILHCINTKDLYFLRLAHLVNAFGKTQGVEKVLSVGCREACQEAFLAARLPDLHIEVIDLFPSIMVFHLPNLHFTQADILRESEPGDFDFVMSIECLEHIEDYRLAFKNMAAKVKPGKYLYISVPFASEAEQKDAELKRINWKEYEHYVPGFTFNDLEIMFTENGFQVIHSGNMFYWDIYPKLNRLLSKMDAKNIQTSLPELVDLFLSDIRNYRVKSRSEGAFGVCLLGQKKESTSL